MNVFDQTTIENGLRDALKAIFGTDYKIYPSRPTSTAATNDSFIVAKVSGSIQDLATYGQCVCSIHLFTKDLSGVKNSAKLSKMYDALANGFPLVKDKLMFSGTPVVVGDTPDDYGYHVRIINIKTTLKIV